MTRPAVPLDREIVADEATARRLLRSQAPDLGGLPLRRLDSAGTDNVLYRIGESALMRLPRRAWASDQAAKESRWLPVIAARLPLGIPAPLLLGAPDELFPWSWTVCPWIDGRDADAEPVADSAAEAHRLAEFLRRLQAVDASDAPRPGPLDGPRGGRLAPWSGVVRRRLATLADEIDVGAAERLWNAALGAAPYADAPRWIHADLHRGNLVVRDGRLVAVIDWGLSGAGDPAFDAAAAWSVFEGEAREAFLDALHADPAMRDRARGWTLAWTVNALAYYRDGLNPALTATCRRILRGLLSDA